MDHIDLSAGTLGVGGAAQTAHCGHGRHTGSIEREFEYFMPDGEAASILFNIEFTYSAGTRRSHPGGHWNSWIGSWDPPEDPDWEIGEVTRQTKDSKWVPVTPQDWFWDAWVVPLWDGLRREDFEDVIGEAV